MNLGTGLAIGLIVAGDGHISPLGLLLVMLSAIPAAFIIGYIWVAIDVWLWSRRYDKRLKEMREAPPPPPGCKELVFGDKKLKWRSSLLCESWTIVNPYAKK